MSVDGDMDAINEIAKSPVEEAEKERSALEVDREKKQYAILLAYGAMADAICKSTKGAAISTFIRNNVQPACDKSGVMLAFPNWKVKQSPYLAANALWVGAQFAEHFSIQTLANEMFDLSLAMMSTRDPDVEEVDDDAPTSWKPIRVVAGHALRNTIECHFDEREDIKDRLKVLIESMIAIANDADDSLSCDRMNYTVLATTFESAGVDVVPYVSLVGGHLFQCCISDLNEGGDLLSSAAFKTMNSLGENIEGLLDELESAEADDEDALPSGWDVIQALAVIEKAFDQMADILLRLYTTPDIEYHPDVGSMIRCILSFISPVREDDEVPLTPSEQYRIKSSLGEKARNVAFLFCNSLSGSVDDLIQADDEFPTFVLLAKYCSRHEGFFTKSQDGPQTSPFEALMQLAFPLMESGIGRAPKAACRILISLFNHKKDDWDESFLEQCVTSTLACASYSVSDFQLAQMTYLLSHVVVRNVELAINASRNAGSLGDLLIVFNKGMPNINRTRGQKIAVWAALRLVNMIGLGNNYSSANRRLCGDLFANCVSNITEDWNDIGNSDDDEESEDDSSGSSDDEEEEEEGDSDAGASEEENEEEFLARYEEEAKKMAKNDGGDEDDDDEIDVLFECDDEQYVFAEMDVQAKFIDWYTRKKSVLEAEVAKRKTVTNFDKFLVSLTKN